MPEGLSLRKNIAWNSIGSFIYLFFQWLATYLVVVLLGFGDAGIFSLAISVSSVAFALALYGIRGYQVSDTANRYSDKSYIHARIATCAIAGGGTVIYLLASGHSLYTTLCLLAYLLFKLSEAYTDVYHGIIQKGMRMDYIGRSFILRGTIGTALFLGTIVVTRSLLLAVAVQVVSSFALILLYDRKKARQFYRKDDVSSTKDVVRLLVECFPLAVYVFLSNVIMSFPRIMLEGMRGSEVLGIYASIAIPAAIIQVVSGFIFSPVLTIFAEHVNQKNFKQFRRLFIRVLSYVAGFSVMAIALGSLFGQFGLELLFGKKIGDYTYLFVPILYVSSLTAVSWFVGLMLTVLRDFKGIIVSSVIALGFCVLSSRWFIETYGINGTSLVLIVALLVQIVIMSTSMVVTMRKLSG